eukprot:jgi/Tetstr1/447676/TSEL_035034.t1
MWCRMPPSSTSSPAAQDSGPTSRAPARCHSSQAADASAADATERKPGGDEYAYAGTAAEALAGRLESLGLASLPPLAPPCAPLARQRFQIIDQADIPGDATVVKSLLWEASGIGPVAVVLGVHRRVGRAKLAAALGRERAGWLRLMEPGAAEALAGASMGNVSRCGAVYGGGGGEGWELRLALGDLLSVSGATVADIAVGGDDDPAPYFDSIETGGAAKGEPIAPKPQSHPPQPPSPDGFPTSAALRKAAAKPDGEAEVRALLAACDAPAEGAGMRRLLDAGTDQSGKTALHMAAWRGSVGAAAALLDAGADLDAHSTGQGNYGKTAIFYALTRCRDDMVAFLLDRGADVLICNNKGQTPRSIAASHVGPETVAALEAAEAAQEAAGRRWRNFRASHSDGKAYGDLDPRFGLDAANGWAPGAAAGEGVPQGAKSVRPTSRESRQARQANRAVAPPSPRAPPFPFLSPASNVCHLVGVVTSKRRIGRALAFVNIVPPPDGESPAECAPFVGAACASAADKYAWRGGGPGGGAPLAVQLIIGRTVKERLGLAGAAEAIRGLHVGQLLHVVGRLGVNGERGAANLRDNSTLDVVVSEYRVLQERFRVPALQQPADRAPERDGGDARDTSAAGEASAAGERGDGSVATMPAEQPPVPALALRDVLPLRGYPRAVGAPVAVVDSEAGMAGFAAAVAQEMARQRGGSAVSGCLGLDCEWAPGPDGGRASPVALLQLATPSAVYLLDLQSLCRPWLEPSAQMNAAEAAVEAALRPMFCDAEATVVGFGVESDLRKLARSFPHMPCFSAAAGAVDVRTLLALTSPQVSMKQRRGLQAMGLSQVCLRVLGRPLDKRQQCSDWTARPLSAAQVEYAALDAAVLLALFAALAGRPPVCKCETDECVQRCVCGNAHLRRTVSTRQSDEAASSSSVAG